MVRSASINSKQLWAPGDAGWPGVASQEEGPPRWSGGCRSGGREALESGGDHEQEGKAARGESEDQETQAGAGGRVFMSKVGCRVIETGTRASRTMTAEYSRTIFGKETCISSPEK